MNQVILKTNKRYFAFVSVLVILLFFIVFIPMRNELKKQSIENYALLAKSKQQTIVALVNSCISNANGLSSRTAIRDFIVDFNNKNLSWSELVSLTKSKYNDGVKVIQNINLAVRYVSDKPLVVWKQGEADIDTYKNLFNNSMKIEYRFEEKVDSLKIIVYSPIIFQNELIAYDIIVVNILEKFNELSKDGFNVKIIKSNNQLLKNIKPEKIYERYSINQHNYMCIAKPIDNNYLIFISKLTDDVFVNINKVSLFSITGFTLGLILIFFMIHMNLVKVANRLIQKIESSRDTCMNYANHDFLTGAYTRFYFDNWIKNKDTVGRFVVVMIDIDCFKSINDTYGHEIGDDVLKFITNNLIGALRENDFVVRFGGDEFIAVYEGISADNVHKIFSKINHNISDLNQFEFEISISYGIEEVVSLDTIYNSIKKADKKMYENKRENKLK